MGARLNFFSVQTYIAQHYRALLITVRAIMEFPSEAGRHPLMMFEFLGHFLTSPYVRILFTDPDFIEVRLS